MPADPNSQVELPTVKTLEAQAGTGYESQWDKLGPLHNDLQD